MRWIVGVLSVLLLAPYTRGQQYCPQGYRIEGTVTDPSGAFVSGASVHAGESQNTVTDGRGQFVLPCVSTKAISVEANGFATLTARPNGRRGETAHLNLRLAVAQVQTDVTVDSETTGVDSGSGPGSTVLGAQDVSRLPDDPDDLRQQLQILAAGSGGDPNSATVVVDGFQNTSALPPKSSIASIRINPDVFSPEYQKPQWNGGRIEITTKTGTDSFHGALFLTDSDSSFNANNPFSVAPTPAGKRRYGVELSGPAVPRKLDFALALEKRDIDEFSVVNATSLNSQGDTIRIRESIPTPQRLWVASARTDWQVNAKDLAALSYSANVNHQSNEGVGGLVLADAGYDGVVSEYDLRFRNALTISPSFLHETRVGFSWKRTQQTPISRAPALQVAGYFTGGGATSQNLNNRERDLEVDDEVLLTCGPHEIKFGMQALGLFVRNYNPDTFNGAYVFGGGSGLELDASGQPTGQTIYVAPLEQYRRALLNLPGGNPTTYQITTGIPLVPFTQWHVGFYVQDNVKLTPHLKIGTGIRYQLRTNPSGYAAVEPRIGLSWAPDNKETWVIHLRAGLFTEPVDLTPITAVERLNGIRQQQVTVYSPSYTDPLLPISGSIQTGTVYQFARSYGQAQNLQLSAVAEHDFPRKWHVMASYSFGGNWQETRAININAPMVGTSSGTAPDPLAALQAQRPIVAGENIIQYQQSGHSLGDVYKVSIDQHGYKRFGVRLQYWYLRFRENPLSPQSTYSSQGDSARPDWMRHGGIAFLGNGKLPQNIDLAVQLSVMAGRPFNITTGTDANGDGNFNDRPAYTTASGPNAYQTRYGLLTSNAVNGDVPYNAGTMPGVLYLNTNLSRVFTLNPHNKEHPHILTFNVRAENLLNHTNVSAVNTVLSSPAVGQPVAAEAARRVELGTRFTF
ncbi:carboxypeptidase regulatory-like domain-containing protein [Terriglobus albidus]